MYKELNYQGTKFFLVKLDGNYYVEWKPIAKHILQFGDYQRSCRVNFKSTREERITPRLLGNLVHNQAPELAKKNKDKNVNKQVYLVGYKALLRVIKEHHETDFYNFMLNNYPRHKQGHVYSSVSTNDNLDMLNQLEDIQSRQARIERKLDTILNNHYEQEIKEINKKMDTVFNNHNQTSKIHGLFASIFGTQGN